MKKKINFPKHCLKKRKCAKPTMQFYTLYCTLQRARFFGTYEKMNLFLDLVQRESWEQFTSDAVPVKNYYVDCYKVHQFKYVTFIPDSSFR